MFLAMYLISVSSVFAIATQSTIVKDKADYNAFADDVYYDYAIPKDETSASTDTTADDVNIPVEVSSTFGTTYLYIGSNSVFESVLFDISTAGSSSRGVCVMSVCHHYDLEYYNGVSGAWESLTYTDNTNNFKSTGQHSIDFTLPSAWDDPSNTKATVNSKTLYWVRLSAYPLTKITTEARATALALKSYNYQITLTDELGNAVNGFLDQNYSVSAGTSNDIAGARDLGSGVYQFGLDEAQTDSNYYFNMDADGFIEKSLVTGVISTTLKSSAASLEYTHKINVLDESGAAVTPDSVYANVTFPKAETVVCAISGTSAYCPLTTLQDDSTTSVTATKSGYDTATSSLSADRSSHTSGQVTTSVTLKETASSSTSSTTGSRSTAYVSVNAGDENGGVFKYLSQSSFVVTGGIDNNIYGFTNNNDGNYYLVLASDQVDNNYNITVKNNGYVSATLTTGDLVTDSTTGLDASAMKFAYKVQVSDASGGAYISDATVNAGDSLNVSCEYIGGADYGCAVPVEDTNLSARAVSSGYLVNYGTFSSDRVVGTDGQITMTIRLAAKDSGTDCVVPFTDIFGHWSEPYVDELYCRGVVSGRSYYSFVPNDNITRAEFLKVALLNAGYDVSGSAEENFSDVSTADWFYEYVSFGVSEGFIEGYSDGTFKPNSYINRAEALVILMRIAGVDSYAVSQSDIKFSDVNASDWFAYAVVKANQQGIVNGYGDGTFGPGNNVSRAEVSSMAVKAYGS